ncbi:hypothetical protein KsCSTR_18430 [Candidatus Kuenenia stuttgartiensis]|uniref:Uncharacterized protein n=1 Tax=Kuenenia stuttgartiensis TaxID=174633 RepID=A0A6G7GPB4_KUEST|nr:hypothetical protein [Candidatus Kuenenia stuttgartiensis]QII11222.1 hypothetical protein KsCSTR_18430 [Candidatus Kuenenia stuttgartiensis]
MENYEAIGRYVANKEKAVQQAITRDNLLKDLLQVIRTPLEGASSSMIAADVNFARAHDLLKKAEDAHNRMARHVAEANSAAEASGNQKLVIGK